MTLTLLYVQEVVAAARKESDNTTAYSRHPAAIMAQGLEMEAEKTTLTPVS